MTVINAASPERRVSFSGLVDTGAAYLTLPSAWKSQLGAFSSSQPIELETATQDVVTGDVCGPAQIEIAGYMRRTGRQGMRAT